MTKFDKETLIEIVLYILNKTQGADIYHVLKIIYFANQKHLVKWGAPMIPDDFRAYEYGPVPEQLYKAMHNTAKYGTELPQLFDNVARYAAEDARSIILPTRPAQMDYLSRATVECLDQSIDENIGLTFPELLKKSHDGAWQKAWERKTAIGDDKMDAVSIAEAAGANHAMLDFIREQLEVDALFS